MRTKSKRPTVSDCWSCDSQGVEDAEDWVEGTDAEDLNEWAAIASEVVGKKQTNWSIERLPDNAEAVLEARREEEGDEHFSRKDYMKGWLSQVLWLWRVRNGLEEDLDKAKR